MLVDMADLSRVARSLDTRYLYFSVVFICRAFDDWATHAKYVLGNLSTLLCLNAAAQEDQTQGRPKRSKKTRIGIAATLNEWQVDSRRMR